MLNVALHLAGDVVICIRHERTEILNVPKERNKRIVANAINASREFSRCITRHIYLPCDVSKQHLS